MHKILITDPISDNGLKILEDEWNSILKLIAFKESEIAGLISELELHINT